MASSRDPDGAELGTPDKGADSALFPGSEAMANPKGERTAWPIMPGVSAYRATHGRYKQDVWPSHSLALSIRDLL